MDRIKKSFKKAEIYDYVFNLKEMFMKMLEKMEINYPQDKYKD